MLDASLSAQLQQLYRDLPVTIVLRQRPSDHAKQDELPTMLADIAATAPGKIVHRVEGETAAIPSFEVAIEGEGRTASILFKGIPGGHEFSSLVLAVLNAAGLGKRPDEGLQNRIRHLKGPVRLRTFVSLSCHNCPEVVQSLNLLAVLNPGVRTTMIDGALFQAEVEERQIMAVPYVFLNGKEFSQGRISLEELSLIHISEPTRPY